MVKNGKNKKEKQLNLGLKQSPQNILYKTRAKISDILIRFKIKEFLRNPFTWMVIILSTCFTLAQIYILVNNLSLYPQKLPIWQNQIMLEKRLEYKKYLYLFPGISVFILLLGALLSNIFYYKEKLLSQLLLLAVLLSVSSLTISFLKLVPSV